ncbi:hypothetical protein [Chitinophaga nivalis]|uniref:Uncharacterized protein n=1 Tax=Chitinophaga nivalis TaxID=2991709 RepID=A0ABT3IIS3_9BACT|nr:hypothetical protein [Chitinophaga nivalis]MCW3466466.1 hypothetical protein [Chitinophaga nivalis]MCW3483843.1 hypothetical protein [Chitinophaga nivalis]
MKKVLLLMLLLGGTVLSTYAQRGYDRGYRGHGNAYGHYKHWDKHDRHERRRDWERRRWDDDCYRSPRRVVYVRPAYYPVVPPPPPRYYPAPRPRAVFHAGVSIVN